MKKPKVTEDQKQTLNSYNRNFPLYGMLVCGSIIFLAGLYLFITGIYVGGYAKPRRGAGGYVTITGPGAMALGFMFILIAAIFLINQKNKKRKYKEK
ncbi:MAG: hypothetical protein JST86_15290 [Bacteroidetes bacterium]|nr:hypothetical protein [Bacteroidota bacterium]